MATVTDTDLQEIKDLINNRFSELDKKLDLHIVRTDERLDSINQNLADLKKQSEKQDNRLWVLISGIFLALLGFVVKFSMNP